MSPSLKDLVMIISKRKWHMLEKSGFFTLSREEFGCCHAQWWVWSKKRVYGACSPWKTAARFVELVSSAVTFLNFSRARKVNDSLWEFSSFLEVMPYKMHREGIEIPGVAESFVRWHRHFRMRYRAARWMQLSIHFRSKYYDALFVDFSWKYPSVNWMPSHESKLQICQSWYQKMRRLIPRRTDKVPGSPDSRNQKFLRGSICGLQRPLL